MSLLTERYPDALFISEPNEFSLHFSTIIVTAAGKLLIDGEPYNLIVKIRDVWVARNSGRLECAGCIRGLDSSMIYHYRLNDTDDVLRCVRKGEEMYWDVPKVLDAPE